MGGPGQDSEIELEMGQKWVLLKKDQEQMLDQDQKWMADWPWDYK